MPDYADKAACDRGVYLGSARGIPHPYAGQECATEAPTGREPGYLERMEVCSMRVGDKLRVTSEIVAALQDRFSAHLPTPCAGGASPGGVLKPSVTAGSVFSLMRENEERLDVIIERLTVLKNAV